ncbi:hypothetical protein PUN28_004375 [Cardiocondyla obscurior]|uniref:Uncharacterized protein n=1 Tax=Cardiocondyla obscurior TaxID=286306 RepID=A0AAW2GEC9_9HYME
MNRKQGNNVSQVVEQEIARKLHVETSDTYNLIARAIKTGINGFTFAGLPDTADVCILNRLHERSVIDELRRDLLWLVATEVLADVKEARLAAKWKVKVVVMEFLESNSYPSE